MSTTVSFPGLGLSFKISRVAFSVGGFDIYWYGVIIAVGLMLGVTYGLHRAKDFGIDDDKLIDAILIGTVAGVLGARLYYIVFSGGILTMADFFDFRKGGLGFYGAVIAAVISAVFSCRWRKIHLFAVVDMAALGFLIGQGIGRWGNFFNQEAFGCNTALPWGMTSSIVQNYLQSHMQSLAQQGMTVDPTMPVHPTFLYESIWCILGFFLLNAYVKHRRFDGEIFLMYVAWNGVARAVIEGLRTDSLYIGGLRVSQLLAAVGTMVAVIAILLLRKRAASGDERLVPYAKTDAWQAEYAAKLAKQNKASENAVPDTEQPEETTDTDKKEL